MCLVGDQQIWVADSQGSLFVFSAKSLNKLQQVRVLDPPLEGDPVVTHMLFVPLMGRVFFFLTNHEVIAVETNSIAADSIRTKRFKLPSDCARIACVAMVPQRQGKSAELWCGISKARILVVHAQNLKTVAILQHENSISPIGENGFTSEIVAYELDNFFLWSAVYPGTTVYIWNMVSKSLMSQVDCKAYLAREEPSIANEYFYVSCLKVIYHNLFVGLSNGYVIVIKRLTMSPMAVLRAHSRCVHAFLAVNTDKKGHLSPTTEPKPSDANGSSSSTIEPNSAAICRSFITLGTGFESKVFDVVDKLKMESHRELTGIPPRAVKKGCVHLLSWLNLDWNDKK